ncbi:MAG TPA: AMP-binding protein, partial [Bacteroidales bacterium]|nr:AMP-binding protein [Bacteroidales bacterium]
MEIKRLFDLLDRYREKFNKPVLFGGKIDGIWQRYSLQQHIENSTNISYGLMKLGIQPGEKIISITTNRPEWNFLDMGIMMCGAIHVPVYPNISSDEYKHIFNHSEAKMIFVAGEEMYSRIKTILPECRNIEKVYTFRNLHGIEHLNELMELGRQNPQPEKLKAIKDSINEDDVVTIIYT